MWVHLLPLLLSHRTADGLIAVAHDVTEVGGCASKPGLLVSCDVGNNPSGINLSLWPVDRFRDNRFEQLTSKRAMWQTGQCIRRGRQCAHI